MVYEWPCYFYLISVWYFLTIEIQFLSSFSLGAWELSLNKWGVECRWNFPMKIFLLDISQDDLFSSKRRRAKEGEIGPNQIKWLRLMNEHSMLTESSSNNFMNLEVETNMSGRKHCIWSTDSSESSFAVGGVRTCCLKIRAWMTE